MNRFLFLLLAIFASSCSSERSMLMKDLQSHSWELTKLSISGVDQKLEPVLEQKISLDFDKTRGHGRAAVNSYEIELVPESRNRISVKGQGMTEMDGPKHLIKVDDVYFSALCGVNTATVSGSTLILESATSRLEYDGHPPHSYSGDPNQTVTHSADESP